MQVQDVMQRNVTAVMADDPLGLALQLMLWNDIRHLPVLRAGDGRVVGVLSERDILRARQDATDDDPLARPASAFMTSPAQHIHPKAEVADAAADLGVKKLGCLPVIDGGRLVGIITVADVLATVAQYPAQRGVPSDRRTTVTADMLMRPEPITARADDAVLPAASKMLAAGVRHLCVVDGDGRVIGIVSDRDVRSAVGDPRRALEASELPDRLVALRVEDVMTADPRSIAPETPLSDLLDALVRERFGALPVVDQEERLLGIVSYVDVLRYLGHRLG